MKTTNHIHYQVAFQKFKAPIGAFVIYWLVEFVNGRLYHFLGPKWDDIHTVEDLEKLAEAEAASIWWSIPEIFNVLLMPVAMILFFRVYDRLRSLDGIGKIKDIRSFGQIAAIVFGANYILVVIFYIPGIPVDIARVYYSVSDYLFIINELALLTLLLLPVVLASQQHLFLQKKGDVGTRAAWASFVVISAFHLLDVINRQFMMELPWEYVVYVRFAAHMFYAISVFTMIKNLHLILDRDLEILQAEARAALEHRHKEAFNRSLPGSDS